MNAEIFSGIPAGPFLDARLKAALTHALETSGGGFRPSLVSRLGNALGMEEDCIVAMATAVEYYHLASLVLDDMPCMDDASTRRGLLCTHRVYGESMAILSALALINRAYFHIWDALNGTLPAIRAEVNELLDECLGLNGILDGQALDLNFAHGARTAAAVERIARKKTGSLLRLSILLPAVACGLDKATRQDLRSLADLWGGVYQLMDDFKDIEWSEVESGKTGMRDLRLERPNLALALGREGAMARLRQLLAESRKLLQALSDNEALSGALQPFQSKLEQTGEAFLAACAA